MSTRRGKSISRRACDLCRDRKVQCLFDSQDAPSCRKCTESQVPCTFLTGRRPRGPPNRRVQEAQRRALLSPAPPCPDATTHEGDRLLQLPIGSLTVEHLIPRPTFRALIAEFLVRVYPLIPLIHMPEFTFRFEACDYDRDPRFFRLCIAICAVTTASIPRQIETYACNMYQTAGQLVERAAHIILACRLSSDMSWQQRPTVSDMIVSVMLSMAAHYAEWAHIGWAYASEATHAFRALELYKREAHTELSTVESELCKRAFWMLCIMQIHDHLSHTTPHTSLCYDPLHMDWDFMLPVDKSDGDLGSGGRFQADTAVGDGLRPIVSGFIALINTFLCIFDLPFQDLRGHGSAQSASLSSRSLPPVSNISTAHDVLLGQRKRLLDTITKLQKGLKELPHELKIPSRRSSPASRNAAQEESPVHASQYAIMRVNIHVTSLYLQSALLDTCLGASAESTESASATVATCPGSPRCPRALEASGHCELWHLRETITTELLDVLESSTIESLEANGLSMIVKIREIAASLLLQNDDRFLPDSIKSQSQNYVSQFADILAKLDYLSRTKQKERATRNQS